jgi:pimeloyl-ACP methyl ester carboxylesterase
VVSADGAVIGYRRLGSGPAVLLVHGGMQAAQHLMVLASLLAGEFRVYVPDRRGRGLSGGYGERFGVQRETEDVQALAAATGASRIFGLSSGALVALRTALYTPALNRVALYEPPLSVGGSVPAGWVARFDREIGAGKRAAALVTALKGIKIEPVLGRLPRALAQPAMAVALRAGSRATAGDVPVAELIPTQHFDMQIVAEMAESASNYARLPADVLLMGGSKSPAYLGTALDKLAGVLPQSHRVTFRGLGHTAAANDGDPARVAGALREFFAAAPPDGAAS